MGISFLPFCGKEKDRIDKEGKKEEWSGEGACFMHGSVPSSSVLESGSSRCEVTCHIQNPSLVVSDEKRCHHTFVRVVQKETTTGGIYKGS